MIMIINRVCIKNTIFLKFKMNRNNQLLEKRKIINNKINNIKDRKHSTQKFKCIKIE